MSCEKVLCGVLEEAKGFAALVVIVAVDKNQIMMSILLLLNVKLRCTSLA
jgi:hypothetical protein